MRRAVVALPCLSIRRFVEAFNKVVAVCCAKVVLVELALEAVGVVAAGGFHVQSEVRKGSVGDAAVI